MPWVSPSLHLREQSKAILTDIVKSRTARSDHRQRAQLILSFSEGLSNIKAGKAVELQPKQAGKWRHRWLSNEAKLLEVELSEHASPKRLKDTIEQILSDLPRSGAPSTFSALQVAQILAVACEEPQDSGVPLSHWSLSTLKTEVIRRQIVTSISTSTLHVFLKSRGIKTA
ncbi:helix-turn-helix domain-containing protein [uncultured Shewanella sp.]|uniref:helix-turn-helix domain-containing protein n=1 Tax=uncultured Shewanella sp. TaxID=173975 RepID=UPI00261F88AB|nr:helix-turn-helix domain-containing protein [uncultured Shewanella sp.]